MTASPRQFAERLTQVLRTTADRTQRKLLALQDEIGFDLDFSGRHYIESLRRGRVPAELIDLEKLLLRIKQYGHMTQEECEALLHSGGHPQAHELTSKWYPIAPKAKQVEPPRQLRTFVVGPPIKHPRQFFGRELEIKRLLHTLQTTPMQHSVILGKRRSGKSSLLQYLMRIGTTEASALRPGQTHTWLPHPETYRWVYIDFQNPLMQQREPLLRRLLITFEMEIPTPCTLDTFMETVDRQTIQHPTVVLLDEIGEGLAAPDLDQRFWNALRALLNDAGNGKLAFLVASHRPLSQLASEQGRTSPFFNLFSDLHLGALRENEARELLTSSPHPFAAAEVDWILQESGRWPFLLQILCEERLLAHELGMEEGWQQRGLQRIEPFRFLLKQ